MARRSFLRSARTALARAIAPELTRGFDAAGGRGRRWPLEARMGRVVSEVSAALPVSRSRCRYLYQNDAVAHAAIEAIITYAVGAGPMPAHSDAGLVATFTEQFWRDCDADCRGDFGALIAQTLRECIVAGDGLLLALERPEGLRFRGVAAEQLDDAMTRVLGNGACVVNGVEFNSQFDRVAYHIRPGNPSAPFESWSMPIRVDAADALHLAIPIGTGMVRGMPILAHVALMLVDRGLLSDALLKGAQIAAAHAGFLTDMNGAAGLPYEGEREGETLDVSLEPGVVRRLPPGVDIKFNTPDQATESVAFLTAVTESIAAALGVPAWLISGDVSRANYSSLRASLTAFKARLEALQYTVLVPQILDPLWKRWVLSEALRNGRAVSDSDLRCEWRFPALPEADPLKSVQATVAMLNAKLMSRREAVAARGESIERVDADIAADPHANSPEESDDEA